MGTLTFNEGGSQTFLGLFYPLLVEVQENQPGQAGPLVQAAEQGRLNEVAYVDPSDPSRLYITQPAARPGTQEETKLEITYEPDEEAEVKIIEGTFTGNWVKCRIV